MEAANGRGRREGRREGEETAQKTVVLKTTLGRTRPRDGCDEHRQLVRRGQSACRRRGDQRRRGPETFSCFDRCAKRRGGTREDRRKITPRRGG